MPPEKELKVVSHAPLHCKSFPEQAGGLDWLYEDLQRHLGVERRGSIPCQA